MTKRFYALGSFLLWSLALFAQNTETLLLRQPDISDTHITFVYAGDIWIADKEGQHPRKLTNNPDLELNPKFSPDGQTIAFTGNYDGNTDIYSIGLQGGNPTRITYHPAADMMRGWLDNETLYFTSSREFEYSLGSRLHSKNLNHNQTEALTMPEAYQGSPSPDGKKWAYIKNTDPSERQRVAFKRYRGGGMPNIWIFDETTHEIDIVPGKQSNDVQPLWQGDYVYFLSDRNKIMNLFRYHTQTKEVEQVSFFEDFDIKTFSGNDKELILEQGGKLHVFDLQTQQITTLKIFLDSDIIDARPHYVDMKDHIRDYAISPTGVRAVFQSRGEIFSVPADKGAIRNISNTPGAHDKYPAWSPDGKWISYISDLNGKYQLVLRDQKAKNDPIYIDMGDTYFYFEPTWSPDSKKIFYADSHLNLFYVDIDSKKITRVDTDSLSTNTGRVYNQFQPSWSTDSNWIAYVKTLANEVPAIFMYHLKSGESKQITDGMSHAQRPTFSADGKYLFFTASTDIGLSYHGLHMTAYGSSPTRSIYAFILSEDTPSPLQPESDEEKVASEKEIKKEEKKKEKEEKKEEKEIENSIKVDLDSELQNRIIALPIRKGRYYQIDGSVKGKLLYTQGGTLHEFDLEKQESKELGENIYGFSISADGKKIMYRSQGNYYIADTHREIKNTSANMVKTTGIKQLVNPIEEWKQVFNEVWHMQKEYFYVENMHGIDWEQTRKQYEPMLEFVKHRADLTYLLNEMMGEMVVGHNYIYPGTQPQAPSVSVGMLGADYTLNGEHYRIEKIFSTHNWNPNLKSPLTMPGLKIKEGDYILEINGQTLDKDTNIYSLFDFTVGKQTSLTINDKPSLKGAREVVVLPISFGQEIALRRTDWMEENRKKVAEMSKDQIAYIYMPNTAGDGYENFNRDYFSQSDKKALLIDERNNGGGKVADYVIDLLSRDIISYWGIRDGKSFTTPGNGIYGPKAMIINENAGSGGDMMPYMFRHKELGKLVGRTTMGILVGISGYPPLLDGGSVTSPNFGVYDLEGNWIIENEGVAPDIFVEQTPKELLEGRDPQLERTVELLLEEMKTYPYKEVPKPADPLRAR